MRNVAIKQIRNKECRECGKLIWRDVNGRTWHDDKDLTQVHHDSNVPVITLTDISLRLDKISDALIEIRDKMK